MDRTSLRIASTILAAAAALTACSQPSPVEQRLDAYWSDLGDGGQQTLCLGLAVKGEEWFAQQVGAEHAEEAVDYFTRACEDVELPSAEALGMGIPA